MSVLGPIAFAIAVANLVLNSVGVSSTIESNWADSRHLSSLLSSSSSTVQLVARLKSCFLAYSSGRETRGVAPTLVVREVSVGGVLIVTGVTGIVGLSLVVNSGNTAVHAGTGSITSVIFSIDELLSRPSSVVGIGCDRNWGPLV